MQGTPSRVQALPQPSFPYPVKLGLALSKHQSPGGGLKRTISSKLSSCPVLCLANNQRHPCTSRSSLQLCFLSCLQPVALLHPNPLPICSAHWSPPPPQVSLSSLDPCYKSPHPLVNSTGVMESDELRPYTREKKLSKAQTHWISRGNWASMRIYWI